MMASASAASPAPPQVLLAHHLRQLKLPTFLREYEKLATEAAREGAIILRYAQFLFAVHLSLTLYLKLCTATLLLNLLKRGVDLRNL